MAAAAVGSRWAAEEFRLPEEFVTLRDGVIALAPKVRPISSTRFKASASTSFRFPKVIQKVVK